MTAIKSKSGRAPDQFQEFDNLLPPPHWLRGADAERFLFLRQNILQAIEPQNFIEHVYGNEMAHLLWQIQEKHNHVASLVANAQEEGLIRLLAGRCDNLADLVKALRRKDPHAIAKLKLIFKDLGLRQSDLDAHAQSSISEELKLIERDTDAKRDQFDRLVQNFEKRRLIIAERLRRLAEIPPRRSPLLADHTNENDA